MLLTGGNNKDKQDNLNRECRESGQNRGCYKKTKLIPPISVDLLVGALNTNGFVPLRNSTEAEKPSVEPPMKSGFAKLFVD